MRLIIFPVKYNIDMYSHLDIFPHPCIYKLYFKAVLQNLILSIRAFLLSQCTRRRISRLLATGIIEKVFETIVKVQLIDHIEDNNLFCKTQHGFRRGHRLSQQSCAPGWEYTWILLARWTACPDIMQTNKCIQRK